MRLLVAAAALRERIVERLRRGCGAGGDVGDLLGIKGCVGIRYDAVVTAAAPLGLHLDFAVQLGLDRCNVLTGKDEAVLGALVVDCLIADRLTDVLELSVDVSVHLQRLLIVVGVRLEHRDLAVLLRELLLTIKLIARDRHILAAPRSHRSRIYTPAVPAAAEQIAEQSEADARRADDTSGQGRVCLAVACVFHRVSLQKCSELASSYDQYEGFQISKGRTKVARMTHFGSISDANGKSPCSVELHGLKIDRKTGPVQAPAPEKDSSSFCATLLL